MKMKRRSQMASISNMYSRVLALKLYYAILMCDIPVVYQLQCRNKCEQQS